MTDNVPITAGSGVTIAADEVVDGVLGTVKVQYVKLMDGTLDGTGKAVVGTAGLKVDISGTAANATALNVNVTNASIPVTGTFWQTTQPVSGTVTVNQGTAGSAWPVSGTVTANIGTSGSLALESGNLASIKTDVDNLNLAQSTTTAGQKGNLGFGAVTTGVPSYTNGQSNPLSLTTSGLLRVDGSSSTFPVTGTFWQATQPVSIAAHVTVDQGTAGSAWPVTLSSTTVTGTVNIASATAPVMSMNSASANAGINSAMAATFDDVAPTAITENNFGFLRMSANRNLYNTIRDAAGNERGANVSSSNALLVDLSATAANGTAIKVDGSAVTQPVSQTTGTNLHAVVNPDTAGNWGIASSAQNVTAPSFGLLVQGEYNTAPSTITSGNVSPLQLDSHGGLKASLWDSGGTDMTDTTNHAVKVNVVAGGASGGTSSNFGSSFPTVGTATGFADANSTPNMRSARVFDTDSGAGTEYTIGVNLRASANGGSTEIGIGSAPLRIDPTGTTTQPVSLTSTTITGTVAVTQSGSWNVGQTGTWNVGLNAGSNIIGKVGIDQTTPGTTNLVSAAQNGNWTARIVGNAGATLDAVIGNATAPTNMIAVGGVFNSTRPTLTTGQSAAFQSNNNGVQLVDGSTVTQPVSGTFWQATQPVSIAAAVTVQQATASNLNATVVGTGTFAVQAAQSGTWSTRTQDGSGNAITSTSGALDINIKSGGGSGGTALGDEAAFTAGTTSFTPAGGLYQTTPTNNALTNGQAGAWQMTANRAGFVNLRNASGTEIGTASNPIITTPRDSGGTDATDTTNHAIRVNVVAGGAGGGAVYGPTAVSSAAANPPVLIGGTANATATGTVQVAKVSSGGLVSVDASGATVPVSGTFWQTTQPVSGTVTVNQGTAGSAWPVSLTSTTISSGAVTVSSSTAPVSTMNSASANSGVTDALAGCFDDVSPTAITENNFGYLRMSGNRNLYGTIRDAAGNERGANVTSANALVVDGSAVTQPVSGTFWQATQPVSIAAAVTVQQSTAGNLKVDLSGTAANATAIKVDGSAVTQPVSLTSTTITGSVNVQSSTTPVSTMNSASAAAGVNSAMAAVFDDVTPTAITENNFGFVRMSANRNQYTTIRDAAGNERGVNVTSGNALVVDGSATTQPVSGTFWQATQPVSGTVTVNQGTAGSAWPVTLTSTTITSGAVTVSSSTAPVSTMNSASAAAGTTGALAGCFDDTSPTAITENNFGYLRMSANRNLYGTIRDAAGNERGANVSSNNSLQVEPPTATGLGNWGLGSAAQNQPVPTNGQLVMGEFNTTPTGITSGNVSPLQLDTNGNLKIVMPATVTTGTSWNSSTTINTTVSIPNNPSLLGAVTTTSTITAGALTFEESYDNGTTWTSVPVGRLINPATGAQLANPYTLVATTVQPFQIISLGTTQYRIRLSTAITGTGAASFVLTSSPLINEVTVSNNNAANLLTSATISQGGNSAVVKGASTAAAATDPALVVTLSPNTPAQAMTGDTASGATDAGNPVKIGAVARTSNPTAVTSGQRVNLMADKLGKLVAVGAVRDLKGKQKTAAITTTSETTIVTAGGASVFNDLYGLTIANSSATGCNVTIKDSTAGTTQMVIYVPATDTRGFMLPVDSAIPQTTANNNWTATCSVGVTSIDITALYVSNL